MLISYLLEVHAVTVGSLGVIRIPIQQIDAPAMDYETCRVRTPVCESHLGLMEDRVVSSIDTGCSRHHHQPPRPNVGMKFIKDPFEGWVIPPIVLVGLDVTRLEHRVYRLEVQLVSEPLLQEHLIVGDELLWLEMPHLRPPLYRCDCGRDLHIKSIRGPKKRR